MGKANREGGRWFGPILGWELVRLARRGSPAVLRVLVGMLLLATLWAVWASEFPAESVLTGRVDQLQTEMARFAERFFHAFLWVQLLAVCLLTPVYVAGAIIEEKERRTLEFLLASDLSVREIVLGKVLSRVIQLSGVLLVGVPILAIMQLWGGVDWLLVGVGYGISFAALWMVAGISAACAAQCPDLRTALVRAYVVGVGFSLMCPVVGVRLASMSLGALHQGAKWPPVILPGVVLPLLFGAATFWKAMQWLPESLYARPKRARRPAVVKAAGPETRHWADPPPVSEEPLLWKELYLAQTNRFVRMLGLVPGWVWVGSVTAWTLALVSNADTNDIFGLTNSTVRTAGLILLGLMALAVGLNAAGSVARERQQQTLDSLLTIPGRRRDILWAKLLGSLARGRGMAYGLVALMPVGLLGGGLAPVAVPLALAGAAVFVAFAACLGLFLSVACRTVLRATGYWMLAVLLWLGGTYLLARMNSAEPEYRWERRELPVWSAPLNPALAWGGLAFYWYDPETDPGYYYQRPPGLLRETKQILPPLLGVGLFGGLAFVLWRAAVWRFEREGRS